MFNLRDLIYSQNSDLSQQLNSQTNEITENVNPPSSSRNNNTQEQSQFLSQTIRSQRTGITAKSTIKKEVSFFDDIPNKNFDLAEESFVNPSPTRRRINFNEELDEESNEEDIEEEIDYDEDNDFNPIDEFKINKNKRRIGRFTYSNTRYYDRIPFYASETSVLYHNTPEIKYRVQSHFGKVPQAYFPNLTEYLAFPQPQSNFLDLQRIFVRELFHSCYYGRDFGGATMALRILADIDSIKLLDIENLLHILRTSSDATHLLSSIATNTYKINPRLRNNPQLNRSLLGLMVQSLLSINETNVTKKIIKEQKNHRAFASCGWIRAVEAVISCQALIESVTNLTQYFEFEFFPTIESIYKDPIEFFYVVRLAFIASLGNTTDRKVNARQHEMKSKLKELSLNFSSSIKFSETKDWLDFNFLYISLLLGIGKRHEAKEFIIKLENYYVENLSDDDPSYHYLLSRFYSYLISMSIKLDHESRESIKQSIVLPFILSQLYYQRDLVSTSSDRMIYLLWVLLPFGLVSEYSLLNEIGNIIERENTYSMHNTWFSDRIGRQKSSHQKKNPVTYIETPFNFRHWILWKMLISLLSQTNTENIVNTTNHSQASLYDLDSYIIEYEALSSSVSTNPGEDLASPIRFLHERAWWLDHILSSALLDEFSSTILPSEFRTELNYFNTQSTDLNNNLTSSLPEFIIIDEPTLTFESFQKLFSILHDEAQLDDSLVDFTEDHDIYLFDAIFLSGLKGIKSSLVEESSFTPLVKLSEELFEHILTVYLVEPKEFDPFLTMYQSIFPNDGIDSYKIQKLTKLFQPLHYFPVNKENSIESIEESFLFGDRFLEILTMQCFLANLMMDNDNFFTLRIVQILFQHMKISNNSNSKFCLQYLNSKKLDLSRILELAFELSCKDIHPTSIPPNFHLSQLNDEILLKSQHQGSYNPLPYS